jgi:hypothetical protein
VNERQRDAGASVLLTALERATATYFQRLDSGVESDDADEYLHQLAGLPLVNADETAVHSAIAQVEEFERALAHDTAARPDSSPIAVAAERTLVEAGSSGLGYAPDISVSADGTFHLTWTDFAEEQGDQLQVHGLSASGETSYSVAMRDERILMRPCVVGLEHSSAWVFYSAPRHRHWSVYGRQVGSAGIGEPEMLSRSDAPALNQEATTDGAGRLHIVFQESTPTGYIIVYRCRDEAGWQPPDVVSDDTANAWDPCVAVDADGTVTVLWSSHRAGRFRLFLRRRALGEWTPVVEVPTAPGCHALHPDMSCDADGRVWITYDSLAVPEHATSGRTRYLPIEDLGRTAPHDPVPAYDLRCSVVVATLHNGVFAQPAAASPIALRAAGAYPKISIDGDGRAWLAYRTTRRLPFTDYVSHVAVRVHDGSGWSRARVLRRSAGTSAEVAVCPGPIGISVLSHGDEHDKRYVAMLRRRAARLIQGNHEEDMVREHLGLPAAGRMAEGGHLSGGSVVATWLTAPITASTVPTWEPCSARAETLAKSPVTVGSESPSRGRAERQIYWGDLHRHSNISRCGAGLDIGADDHYRFAEDVFACDFWALTDHAENTSNLSWHELKKLANAFYRPGLHVPFVGFEWTSFRYGHMNVIYAGSDGPIFSSNDPEADDPIKLWAQLREHKALTIPHHPASWVYATDWNFYDKRFLRLVEVFQAATGSYESPWCPRQYQDAIAPGASVQEALNQGLRLGLIASTDHRYGAAYAGVYADRLDRESILEGLAARRCFAATRRGIVPALRIGPADIGEEISIHQLRGATIDFGGTGIAELSAVDLIRDGEVIASAPRPNGSGHLTVAVDLQYQSASGGTRDCSGVLAVTGGAQILPVSHYPPEVLEATAELLRWSTRLPRRYGREENPAGTIGLGVTVTGPPDAQVSVTCATTQLTTTLAELSTDQAIDACSFDGVLRLRRGVGGLTSLGSSTWQGSADDALLRPDSWYYVRVIQVDGEMAWSSPIWVVR